MDPEKAIEILEDATHFHFPADGLEFRDAVKLGIEALKEIQHLHKSQVLHDDELLPGAKAVDT